jgi:hypothetical protein
LPDEPKGKSFPQEVRNAVDMYLDVPPKIRNNSKLLAHVGNESANRAIRKLDETIA